ncbi:MAG: lipoate--protein ligase [Sphingobacteriia bacterium]|nr:lipoate--protein ligase [Sphingobacteriia bacterium]
MICIQRDSTNPYFNLAAEEYVLKNYSDDIFMLWQNEPCIIVGKHQNTLAEVNPDFVTRNNIPVVRRISGGGTVFHDLGNLNFTFISNGDEEKLVNFRKFTDPVIEVLQNLGLDARFEGRNDITVEGRKISGNAEHVHKNRILHHGTLLFSSQLTDLSDALRVSPEKFHDKAVKSVRSRVTNISEHLTEKMDVIEFKNRILDHIVSKYKDVKMTVFSNDDVKAINKLVDEKYNTWEWNYGYSPGYSFRKRIKANGGSLEFLLDVHNGIIREAKIFGDYFGVRDTEEIEQVLKNTPHHPAQLKEKLENINLSLYFSNITREEFLSGLF